MGTIISARMPSITASIIVLALAACSSEKSVAASDVKEPVAEQAVSAPPLAREDPRTEPPGQPEDKNQVIVNEKTDGYTFQYSYPVQVNGQSALKKRLDQEGKDARAELVGWAREGQDGAKADGRTFNAYDLVSTWAVVTDLPGWLSLSNETYSFTGGAHGNTGYGGILWDKKAGQERKPETLFVSPAAMTKALRPAMCNQLDVERSKRREEKVVRNQEDWASACIELKDTTIIFGSSNHKTFNRIGFIMAPYSAGPYVEGTYEVTLPVTPAVLAAIKPEFRGAFSVKR